MKTSPIKYDNKLKVPELKLSKSLTKELSSFYFKGFEFRKQYQPQCIASVINSFNNPVGEQYHLGCGAGKTTIFLAPLVRALYKGEIKKALITAPRLALIVQHVEEIDQMISSAKENGFIEESYKLVIVEISSKGQKVKVKNKKDFDEEQTDDLTEMDEETIKQFKNVNYIRSSNNRTIIDNHMQSKNPVLFVGCIPSIQDVFLERAKILNIKFDVCINDEYHNLISQERNKTKKQAFTEIFSFFKSILSFSATPKRGKSMSSLSSDIDDDNIFGIEVANVTTAYLKEFGYLKKHFKVIFVEAGTTRSISDSVKEYLEAKKINPQQFFQEQNIMLRALEEVLSAEPDKKPHALTATSRVAIIKEIINERCEFGKKLKELVGDDVLFELVTGGTKEDDRSEIFDKNKKVTKEIASLLMQHSVIAEGINITNFNVAILLRGMSQICLNQFINRVTRSHDDYDTAYIFIQIEKSDNDSYKREIRNYLEKLMFSGLSLADIDVEAISINGKGGSTDDPENDFEMDINITLKKVKLDLEQVIDDLDYEEEEAYKDSLDDEEFFQYFVKNRLHF